MLTEVKTAVGFLTHVLLQNVGRITLDKIESFASALEARLCARYNGHWFPEWPAKGSGFRCIRINHQMDPLLAAVGAACGIPNLASLLPFELTLWIDPREVALRIGENGSVGVLYSSGQDVVDSDSDTCATSSGGCGGSSSSAASSRPGSADFRRQAAGGAVSPDSQHASSAAVVATRHAHVVGPSSCAADVMYVSCKEQLRGGGGRRPPPFSHYAAYVSS